MAATGSLVELKRMVFEHAKVRIYVITMLNGENRFNPSFLRDFLDRLDEVEQEVQNCNGLEGWGAALITTGGGGQPAGKFYSNGIDLRWVAERREAQDNDALRTLGKLFGAAVARILSFSIPTFAGTLSPATSY
jgi:enoyl-CoA hydratase/carnithine racemase